MSCIPITRFIFFKNIVCLALEEFCDIMESITGDSNRQTVHDLMCNPLLAEVADKYLGTLAISSQ